MSDSATAPRPRLARLLLALALCAVAILAWRAAPTLAHGANGACATSASGAHRAQACAEATRSTRAHRATKRHHGKSSVHSKKKRKAPHGASRHTAAPAPQPASCEDGSTPVGGAEGYECADGSEPGCADGVAPVSRGGVPLCPVASAASAGDEWSEAGCDDGSAPSRTSAGRYACEDGSAPECEDGSAPSAADEASPLACLVPAGSNRSPSPARGGEEAEDEAAEASADDAGSSRVASGS